MAEPVVLRAPKIMLGNGIALVVNALLLSQLVSRWLLVGLPIGLAACWTWLRVRTVADDAGIEVRTVRGTRRVAWADVTAIASRRGVVAVRRDGAEVALPNVRWRPPLPAGYVEPHTAQALVERARAAGHDIALDAG